ncbi:MAG: hypothetical protein N2558_03420 [Patescibacteria group bacterium]|nr:hypothetical protein [Patescibacteria group bacterium]
MSLEKQPNDLSLEDLSNMLNVLEELMLYEKYNKTVSVVPGSGNFQSNEDRYRAIVMSLSRLFIIRQIIDNLSKDDEKV